MPPSDSGSNPTVGVLLTNIGTPAAPTARALRPYLAQFLSDRRVIEWPRWLWLPILYGIVLLLRPARSARLYRNIWTPEGSPLLVIARLQAEGIARRLQERTSTRVYTAVGLRYGQPSIAEGLHRLRTHGAQHILVFPLFPQYSAATTASAFDAVFDTLKTWRHVPAVRSISSYHLHPAYLDALAASLRAHRAGHGAPNRLLFSFHGIPQSQSAAGDPYADQCRQTAQEVAARLDLPADAWALAFQSRFGMETWLQPYTDETLQAWGAEKLSRVDVLCPGFSADCLETLDEIGREARHTYEEAGGRGFAYVPALNDRPEHLDALATIAAEELQGWIG